MIFSVYIVSILLVNEHNRKEPTSFPLSCRTHSQPNRQHIERTLYKIYLMENQLKITKQQSIRNLLIDSFLSFLFVKTSINCTLFSFDKQAATSVHK